jgi:hypothetical protein
MKLVYQTFSSQNEVLDYLHNHSSPGLFLPLNSGKFFLVSINRTKRVAHIRKLICVIVLYCKLKTANPTGRINESTCETRKYF